MKQATRALSTGEVCTGFVPTSYAHRNVADPAASVPKPQKPVLAPRYRLLSATMFAWVALPAAAIGNTTKSFAQLAGAVTSNVNLAGNTPSATPAVVPSDTAQSVFIVLSSSRGIGMTCLSETSIGSALTAAPGTCRLRRSQLYQSL